MPGGAKWGGFATGWRPSKKKVTLGTYLAHSLAEARRWRDDCKTLGGLFRFTTATLCTPAAKVGITRLTRWKESYSQPNQPVIWIRPEGFGFEFFVDIPKTKEEAAEAGADQIERFLVSKTKAGGHYPQRDLEAQRDVIGIPRDRIRAAVSVLTADSDGLRYASAGRALR